MYFNSRERPLGTMKDDEASFQAFSHSISMLQSQSSRAQLWLCTVVLVLLYSQGVYSTRLGLERVLSETRLLWSGLFAQPSKIIHHLPDWLCVLRPSPTKQYLLHRSNVIRRAEVTANLVRQSFLVLHRSLDYKTATE